MQVGLGVSHESHELAIGGSEHLPTGESVAKLWSPIGH